MTPKEMIAALFAANADIVRLTAERDEARREICERHPRNTQEAHQNAIQRGWDCYKEKNHNA